jgi:autotransporter-associated beta strand protein
MAVRWIVLGVLLWGLGGLASAARADCTRAGDTVSCDGFDADGFAASDPGLQVTVAAGAQVRNRATANLFGACDDPDDALSPPAIAVGDRARVTNRGVVFGLGVCGRGIAAGNGAAIVNAGSIATFDTLGIGIVAGDGATVQHGGRIDTAGTAAYGIAAGDGARIVTAAGSTIATAGASAAAIAAGSGAAIANAGQLATTGFAADGIVVGNDATVTNTGTIVASAAQSAGIRVVGDRAQVDNRGTVTAINLQGPSVRQGAGIAIAGADASVTNAGTVTGSYAGLSLVTAGSARIVNSGNIAGGGEVPAGGARADSGGIVVQGTGTLQLTNSGTIAGAGGRPALRSDVTTNLVNRGTISGDVLLSGGDDFVTLGAGSAIAGRLDGGGGIDRLVLDGFGTMSRPVGGFAFLTKIGAGTWTLAGPVDATAETFVTQGTLEVAAGARLASARVTVSAAGVLAGAGTVGGSVVNGGMVTPGSGTPGTLTIGGDYIQRDGATLRLRLGANGQDRLSIGGAATLGGTLTVEILGRLAGGNYPLISSSSGGGLALSGAFARVGTPVLAFMRSELVTAAEGLSLRVARTPYRSAATTRAEGAVADMLDRQTSPALAAVLDGLERGDAASAHAAFAALAPENGPATATLALAGLHALRDLRDAGRGPVTADPPRAWVGYLDRRGRVRSQSAAAPYSYGVSGGAAGIDIAAGASRRVGFALASVDGAANFAAGPVAALPLTVLSASAVQAWSAAQLEADAAASFGFGTARLRRIQNVAGAIQPLGASAAVKTWSADGGLARRIRVAGFDVTTRAGLAYGGVAVAGYDEGAPLSLRAAPATTQSLEANLALRIGSAIGRIRPAAGLVWSQELLANRRQVAASLVGVADSAFVIAGAAPRRSQLAAEGGLALALFPGMTAEVRYQGSLNDALAGHRFTAGATWRW